MNAIEILLDGSRGIYIPQNFAEKFDLRLWSNIDEDDIETIAKGPHDNEWYWEAWQDILDNAQYKYQGRTWHLWQDGDLFAYCEELMTEKERKDFFGEM